MAICFARVRYVGRSTNGNACNSSAYNARSKIVDEKTGEVFNYEKRGGSVYHEMLLPEHVDKKFKDISVFANEVERSEKRKDSQLFEEWVLALPKEKEITLEMKKELALDYVKSKNWVQEGLGVQVNIHARALIYLSLCYFCSRSIKQIFHSIPLIIPFFTCNRRPDL